VNAGASRQAPHDAPPDAARVWLRVGLVALAAAHGALWWRAAAWWPLIPERFPTHFDLAGKPDGWSNRSLLSWFALPLIALALGSFVGGIGIWIGALARNTPGIVNVPQKDLFLKLSPEGRASVVMPTRLLLLAVLVLMQVLFLAILEGTGRVATGEQATLSIAPVVVFMPLVGVAVVFGWLATANAITRAARAEGLSR
jgi:uncharacterized membrane protein